MKVSLLTLLKIYGPMLCFITLSAWLGYLKGYSMRQLVADPSEISGQSSFIGFFSQVGNLLWCATTAICLLPQLFEQTELERIALNRLLF
jgi:hypothetical protein